MSPTTSTILVAEENDAMRAFLAEQLSADGYRVLARARPGEGARAAQHRAPGPDPARRQRTHARAARRDPLRRGPRRPRRPGHAADRAEPRREPAAADPGARARRRRRRPQAVRLPRAACPDRRRAATLGDATVGADPAASGRSRSTLRSREVRVADRLVELTAKEYELLVTLAGEPTPGVHPRRAAERGLGAADVRAHRARSTAMPPAFAGSCAAGARIGC